MEIEAWQGMARHGVVGHGKAGQGDAWQGSPGKTENCPPAKVGGSRHSPHTLAPVHGVQRPAR